LSDHIDVGKLYEDFSKPLKAFIGKRVNDPALAEDLLHDVFLKIHNQIGSLKEKEKLAPWIYRIAQNSVIDSYRRRKEMIPAQEDLAFDAKQFHDIPEKLAPTLKALTEQLPGKYKEALLLADFEGIKQTELAARFGISVSAVKSRVQRARKMLKDLLLECCHFEFDRYGTVFDYHPKNCNRCCGDSTGTPQRCSDDNVAKGLLRLKPGDRC
jgi:RNA polymerase sigma-70 factor, ECF subfamily